ncbi:mannose-1-phosphate guanylyltransferase/mannose-6-phosphate isomerase [Caulobacter sp. ErkDOM-E]|uniref:mannose-1-phosphate guanylyltransferase/mannose-6-phosphate isomerase n=1 Tax=Caulobacter sp. ErkDOM-E TaxID=3402778 RepID=UPI003AF9CE1B
MGAIYPVILCGGSGTRLWPASRADQPKQFLKLIGQTSSFQDTVLRVKDLPGRAEIVIVTGEAMVGFVQDQTAEIGVSVTVLVEPEARDSAPAVAAAAAYVEQRDPDGVALMLAADHHIVEPEIFAQAAITAARAADEGLIVTFGVKPTGPATGFGYIRPGKPLLDGSVSAVAAFVEKPDRATAETYVAEGYYWNSGNFAFKAAVLLGELDVFEPTVSAAARACMVGLQMDGGTARLDRAAFAGAAKISLDYAVMERTQKAAVAPAAFSWSDLGAWDAIWDVSTTDPSGNAAVGDVTLIDSRNVLVRSTGPFVGAIGVEDLVIIAEPDAILVCRRDASQAVKTLVDGLKRDGRSIAIGHDRDDRPRRVLAAAADWEVSVWTLAPHETAALPPGSVQVLAGETSLGALLNVIEAPTIVTAQTAATLLVTRRP